MNFLEKRFLKSMLKKEVRQGGHDERIEALYQMIRDAAEEEFTEDNWPTLDAFLGELFMRTQRMTHHNLQRKQNV